MDIKPPLLAMLGVGPNAADPVVTDPASYLQRFCYGVAFLFFAAFILRLFLKLPQDKDSRQGFFLKMLYVCGWTALGSLIFCWGLQDIAIWVYDGGSFFNLPFIKELVEIPGLGWCVRFPVALAQTAFHNVGWGYALSFATEHGYIAAPPFWDFVWAYVSSVGVVEEATKLLLAVWLARHIKFCPAFFSKRTHAAPLAITLTWAGFGFGAGEAFHYLLHPPIDMGSTMSDIVWFAFLRGSVCPLLHVSFVFLNGMICRARDFHPCSNLFVWIPFPFVVFPAAFVHGFYDAVLPYENLPGFSGLAVLVLQWAIILVFIGALFLALYEIKVSAGDSKPDLRVSEALR